MSRKIPMRVERPKDTPQFYAESVQVVHSISSFKLVLFSDRAEYSIDSSVGPEALMPKTVIKEVIAEVSFSPQQMKILASIINNQLAAYENRFGEIKLPNTKPKHDGASATYV
ncbi:MAG: DUF3467 domain-containing protein [Candidatus Heimdallarchaeaceae archaeon]